KGRDGVAMGRKPRPEQRTFSRLSRHHDGGRGVADRTDQDDRVGVLKLSVEWRTQRTGRNHLPIANPAAAVDDEHGEVLGERGILEAVVHYDDAPSGSNRGLRSCGAVMRDDRGRLAREQQRLVANVGGAIALRVDKLRAALTATIATA